MNSLIRDWIEFCENRKEFDKTHFYSLFWEDIESNDLKTIFRFFPNSDDLFHRTNDYLFGENLDLLKNLNGNTKEQITELAFKDVIEKRNLVSDNKTLKKLLENLQLEFIQDYELVVNKKAEHPYCDFFDELEFQLTERWLLTDKKAFALYEAFYGLSKSYEMTWYLYRPLINTEIEFKNYYDLSRLGGAYSFLGSKLIVSRDPKVEGGTS